MSNMEDELRSRLAETVTLWMKARKETPTTLHKKTGIGRPTIYNLVNGSVSTTVETLSRIAAELGTTPSALLEGRGPAGPVSPLVVPDPSAFPPQLAKQVEAIAADVQEARRRADIALGMIRAMAADEADRLEAEVAAEHQQRRRPA